MDQKQLDACDQYARLIKAIAQQKFDSGDHSTSVTSELQGEVVQGGPKIQELPEEEIPKDRLLEELDFSPELSESDRKALQEIVILHKKAFGLDGKLGNYNAKVEIKLRPGSKEISLPPYNASPAKREVIDK